MPNPVPMEKLETDPFMTTEEVAIFFRSSKRNICLKAELGEIPGFKFGSQWRFLRTEIQNIARHSKPLGSRDH